MAIKQEFDKEIVKLSLKYQEYLTYLSIIWTIAISLFIAITSYIFVSWPNIKEQLPKLIMLDLILVFMEIFFIALYFWINNKKKEIVEKIDKL